MAARKPVEPSDSQTKLAKSFERLRAISIEVEQDMRLLMESLDPTKDAMQINQQLSELITSLDWSQVSANLKDPAAYTDPLNELVEIQNAAMKELSQSQQRAFQSALSGSQAYLGAFGGARDPASLVAAMIDANIDQFEEMKANAVRLAQDSARIKAAYVAWAEKTLRALTESR